MVDQLRSLWESGRHSHVLREVLSRWDEIMRCDGRAVGWIEPMLRRSGLPVEAFAFQAELLRRQHADADQWAFLIESILNSGDPWWARQLLEQVGTTSRHLQALQIETTLAIGQEDAAEPIGRWGREYTDQPAREKSVEWWIRCGRIAEAERVLQDGGDLPLWRARLMLWRRDSPGARVLLREIPQSPHVRCLEGIADVQEGAFEAAEAILRPLLETEARGDAAIWLCTVLRKQRRFREAQQVADIASFASPAFHLVPRLDRELAAIGERAGGDNPHGTKFRALRHRLALRLRPIRKLENAPALYALGLRPRDSMVALEAALERFGGNHSAHLTTVEGGALKSYTLPQDPRHLGATIQRVLWTRGPDAARALYRELAPRVSGHPLLRIYQGELELWMGAYDEAARLFREAIGVDRRTRWAWIGLGASHMFQGELSEAQKIWQKGLRLTGFPGPTLFVYRGECYRRQGDVGRARKDLETALQQKPQRLSAQINMALMSADATTLDRAERECITNAPILMEQLTGTTAERLEQVLEAMRGNRSSSPWHVSYHLWGRIWRRSVAPTET